MIDRQDSMLCHQGFLRSREREYPGESVQRNLRHLLKTG